MKKNVDTNAMNDLAALECELLDEWCTTLGCLVNARATAEERLSTTRRDRDKLRIRITLLEHDLAKFREFVRAYDEASPNDPDFYSSLADSRQRLGSLMSSDPPTQVENNENTQKVEEGIF